MYSKLEAKADEMHVLSVRASIPSRSMHFSSKFNPLSWNNFLIVRRAITTLDSPAVKAAASYHIFGGYFLPKNDMSDFIPERSTLSSLLFFLTLAALIDVGRFAPFSGIRRRSNRWNVSIGPASVFATVLTSFSFSTLSARRQLSTPRRAD